MIIATHPGRYGDILWALPTVRALAEACAQPIHLRLSAKYGTEGFCELLRGQDYLATVHAMADWQIEESAPIGPRIPPSYAEGAEGAQLVHLGYEGWPAPTLPEDVYRRVASRFQLPALELGVPWLTLPSTLPIDGMDMAGLSIGFTDEHFELKFGLTRLVIASHLPHGVAYRPPVCAAGSRWAQEGLARPATWVEAARMIVLSRVFLGCCSALHVLAVGLGVPAVIMEPNPHRHHGVFWPLGTTGPVTLVRGNDGAPTFDARHVADAVRAALEGRR